MAARETVPVLLLTGFLGSGKTSLLARWLKAPEFEGAMVIVNELGEVGIDDRLVAASSDAPLLLDNGCACCAAGEDLTATLERLFWDRLHRKIPKFSWVLIETTGVADPAPILDRLARHSLVSERYRVEGVVAVFDARRGVDQLARHPECASQLEHARAVIITKTDISTEAEIAAAEAAAARAAPGATALRSANADVSAAAVVAALAKGAAAGRRHHQSDHIHAIHSDHVTTAFAALPEPVSRETLVSVLESAMERFGPALLRLKGFVRLAPEGAWRVAQAMPGEGVALTEPPLRIDDAARAGLTIIAQEIEARTISRAICARLVDEGAFAVPMASANAGADAR